MIIVLLALLGSALVGAPLFVIMGATTIALFIAFGGSQYEHLHGFQTLVVSMTDLTTKNVFLAIPFFIAAGAVMTEGGIAGRLIRLAKAVVGWLPGGLAVSTVGSAMIFAAISGSSPVTLIAVGTIMFPALVQAGYRENFALGLVTSAGSLGILIPPSVPMIIYALAVSGVLDSPVDVGDLFLGGVGPGLLMGGLLALWSVWQGIRMPETRIPFSWAELRDAVREGIWALLLPGIILGGIYSGFFTATEAAAVALVYSIVATVWIYGDLKLSQIPSLFVESAVLIGSIILIIVFSFSLNGFLVEAEAADWVLAQIDRMDLSPAGFFLVLNFFLIIIGALMDPISAILIFAPLLAPVAAELGIDPVHLGVVFIVNMEIGYLTPPVATNLFVAAAVFRKSFGQVAKSVLPSLGFMVAGLIIVMYVPTVTVGLVNVLHDRPFYVAFPWDGKPQVAAEEEEDAAPAAGGVMSLQEMMRAAKQNAEGSEVEASVKPADAQPRVMSLQEMMKAAKAQAESESAGEDEAASDDAGEETP